MRKNMRLHHMHLLLGNILAFELALNIIAIYIYYNKLNYTLIYQEFKLESKTIFYISFIYLIYLLQ